MVPPKDRLKIAILSREPKSYSTRRLKEPCKLKGHRVRVLDTKGFAIHVSQDKPFLYYKNRKLEKFDAHQANSFNRFTQPFFFTFGR